MQQGLPEFKRGLTWRVMLALILAALVFMPASIYLNLVAGTTVASAAIYVIVLIFNEFARRAGVSLTPQELFLIFAVVGGLAATIPPYYWWIYRAFFTTSPFTSSILVNGVPLNKIVPSWLSPPQSSPIHELRTLFHPDWMSALAVTLVSSIIYMVCDLSLALMFSKLFIEVEKLPFPFAQINASLINVLAEEPSEEMRSFMYALYFGMIFAGFTYLPYIAGLQLVPLPWADFTSYTQTYLPGAVLGISTDPSTYVSGFVLPPYVTACMLIGSLITWTIGNTLLLTSLKLFPEWVAEYHYGMGINLIYQRSYLRVWLPFQFGLVIGYSVVIIFMIRHGLSSFVKSLFTRASSEVKEEGFSYPSFKILISVYLVGALISVSIFHYLIPEYPLYIPLIISVGFSFFASLIASQSVGITGQYPVIPWPWKPVTYLFTDYSGVAGYWFAPYISIGSVAGVVASTKTAYLTKTHPLDLYKTMILSSILALSFGFIFMDFFWRMAPIPSSVYPYTMIYWPTYIMEDLMYVTRKLNFRLSTVSGGAVFAVILGLLEMLLGKIGIPFSAIALITGTYILTPVTLAQFLGSLISWYVIPRFTGRERWERRRNIFVAGFFTGSSLIVAIGFALALLSRATWIWPW